MARPTKYKPEYNEQVYKLCLLGATDEQIARFFEVTEKTVNNWKTSEPEFLQSLKRGKDDADAVIAESLFHRAKGYTHKAVQFNVIGGEVVATEYDKHYPPDTTAAIFWLKNRASEQWRDVTKVDKTITHENRQYSPVELAHELAAILTAGEKGGDSQTGGIAQALVEAVTGSSDSGTKH